MKNTKLCIILIFAVTLTLFFSGCSVLDPQPGETTLRIIIGTDNKTARTISPVFSSQNFTRYDVTLEGGGYIFTISSATPDFTLENSEIKLVYPNGLPTYTTYTITVKGFRAGENGNNYSAFGSKDFTLTPGATTIVVTMSPITTEGTTGTLSYTITGDGNVYLLPYSSFDPEPEPDPESLPGAIPLTVDGITHNLNLQSGYYVIYYNEFIDVVLLYKNFLTEVYLNL